MASQDAQTQLNGGMAPLGVYISANEFAEPLYILSHSMLLEVITRGAPPPLSLNTPTFPAAVRGHFAYTQSWLEENPTSSNSQFPANVYTTTASHVATQQNINFNSVEDGWQQTSAHDLSTPHTTPFSVQDGWSVPQIPPDVASPMPTGLSAPHQMQIPSQAPSFTLTTAAPTTSPGGAPLAHISTPHVPGPPGAPDAGILGASQSGNSTRNSSAARAQRQSTCENCYLNHKRCSGGIPCKRCTLTGMPECVPHERRQRRVRGTVLKEETLATNENVATWYTQPGSSSNEVARAL